jgi:hypothetical protein
MVGLYIHSSICLPDILVVNLLSLFFAHCSVSPKEGFTSPLGEGGANPPLYEMLP